jgi:hypothetical protein
LLHGQCHQCPREEHAREVQTVKTTGHAAALTLQLGRKYEEPPETRQRELFKRGD